MACNFFERRLTYYPDGKPVQICSCGLKKTDPLLQIKMCNAHAKFSSMIDDKCHFFVQNSWQNCDWFQEN